MLSRKFLLGLTLVLIPILNFVTMWILRPTNILLNEKDYEGVIFMPDNAANVLRYTLLQENIDEAYWLPSQAYISRIETQLTKYVRKEIPSLEGQIVNYKRQYFGFYRKEKPLVLIIGFCGQTQKDWHQELISISDVPPGCYFEAQYDVANGGFLYFWQSPKQ